MLDKGGKVQESNQHGERVESRNSFSPGYIRNNISYNKQIPYW
jgi:hypothetical protein